MQWGMPWWIGHGPPTRGVEVAAEQGFDAVEVSLEAPWPEALDADALVEAAADAEVDLGFHAPWRGQSLGHPRPALAEAARQVAGDCLAFAEATGGDYVVLHVDPRDFGGYPDEGAIEQGLAHAVAGLEALVDRAEAVDVIVENTWPPTGTPSELTAILEQVAGLGFCFDPGHAAITALENGDGAAEPGVWAETVGDRWSLLHLMDLVVRDGQVVDHLVPGAGEHPVQATIDAARQAGCKRCVVEAFYADADGTPAEPEDLGRALAALRG